MVRILCASSSTIHVIALAICTYIATQNIVTILFTGMICSATGWLATIWAVIAKRYWLALICSLTPLTAITLLVLETQFMNLGAAKAELPFRIVFLINQSLTTVVVLAELNLMFVKNPFTLRQITMRTLLVAVFAFASFCGVARILLEKEHSVLMAIALVLLGLTFIGLIMLAYFVWFDHSTNRTI